METLRLHSWSSKDRPIKTESFSKAPIDHNKNAEALLVFLAMRVPKETLEAFNANLYHSNFPWMIDTLHKRMMHDRKEAELLAKYRGVIDEMKEAGMVIEITMKEV